MPRPICISLFSLGVFLIMGSGIVHALIYNQCPDCTELCYDSLCLQTCPSTLCEGEEIGVYQSQIMKARWTSESNVPINGVIENDRILVVNSVRVSVTMKTSGSSFDVSVKAWNCEQGEFSEIETVNVNTNENTWEWDITDYVLACTDEYLITIEPDISGGKYLIVSQTNLTIDYDWEIIYGELSVSMDTELPPDNTIGKYNSMGDYNNFSVTSWVTCSGGDCGNVKMILQYREESSDVFNDVPITETGGEPFYTSSDNPYYCGTLNSDNPSCSFAWTVYTTEIGGYFLRIVASSEDYTEAVGSVESTSTPIVVKVGELSVNNVEFSSNPIETGQSTILSGSISCADYYCGDINVYAKNGPSTIANGTDFTIYNPNPQTILGMDAGDSEIITWKLTGETAGEYPDIHILAGSVEIISVSSYPPSSLIVNEPPPPGAGYLSVQDTSISPDSIEMGSKTLLSGTVVCNNDPCGNVMAYARKGDINIPSEGYNLTTPYNPQQPGNCLDMQPGDLCQVSWEITGNWAGTYENINIMVSSDKEGVNDNISGYHTLYVEEVPPGEISLGILSPQAYSVFFRGDGVLLKLNATKNSEPEPGLSATASFSRSLFPDIVLHYDGEGIYSNSVNIPPTAMGEYTITFWAGGEKVQTWINVSPELEVFMDTDKNNYSTGEVVEINGTILRGGVPIEGEVDIDLMCGEWKSNQWAKNNSDSSGNYYYLYELPLDAPEGTCEFKADAIDIYGNHGSVSIEISVLKSEFNIYNVTFLAPKSGEVFRVGDGINITVSVLSVSAPVGNAEVTCTDIFGNMNIGLNHTREGYYSGGVSNVQRNPLKDIWTLSCTALTEDGFFGSGFVNIEVRPVLWIEIIEPVINETERGETIHFILKVFYSDGLPMENGTVYMRVGNETVNFTYSGNGIYKTDYEVEIEGSLDFEFFALDAMGDVQNSQMSIESKSYFRVNWLAIIMTLAGIAIIASILFANKIRKGKTVVKTVYRTIVKGPDRRAVLMDKIKDLENKSRAIERAKESAEMEYYQRKINEKEFRKMMENYEQELLTVEAEIRELRNELMSLRAS